MHWPLNRRILIIDDNPSIHDDYRKVLSPRRVNHSSLEDQEAVLFGDTSGPSLGAPSPTSDLCFEIDSTYQGEEGYERIAMARQQGRPYAMAFVDVRMPPGWDGIETIEHILPVDPEIHFVICSAYSDYAPTDIITRLGLTERLLILRKPCETAEILLIAANLCQKWNLMRAFHVLQQT